MQTIALINQKGGVGKTTTAANLAAGLAARGRRVAAIDMDPQSHLTMHFGIEPGSHTPGIYEMLTQDAELADAAVEVHDKLRVIPASIDLAGAEIELVSTVGREQLLADRLAAAADTFDYVLIDCPPSLSLLTLNALTAADEVIIPLQPHFLALQGFGKLLETIALVRRRVNPRLRVGGVILCMYESNTRLAGEVSQDVAEFLSARHNPDDPWAGARLYESRIRRNVKLAECPSFGESIFRYAPGCPGAVDYEALTEEFLAVHAPPAPESEGEPAAAPPADAKAQALLAPCASAAQAPEPAEPVAAPAPTAPTDEVAPTGGDLDEPRRESAPA